MKTILRIDSSPRKEASVSRQLTNTITEKLKKQLNAEVLHRDVYYDSLVYLGDEDQVNGYFTPENDQTEAQKKAIANSNTLATEFAKADIYVMGTPMYNFGVSAGLKTYIDLIVRAGISFKYTESGPVGLLENKKAYIAVATGGTPVGAEVDFTSTYLKTILGFIGIKDVEIVAADELQIKGDSVVTEAKTKIESLLG